MIDLTSVPACNRTGFLRIGELDQSVSPLRIIPPLVQLYLGLGVLETVGEVGVLEMVGEVGVLEMVGEVGVLEMVGEVGVLEMVGEVGVLEMVGEVGVLEMVGEVGVLETVGEELKVLKMYYFDYNPGNFQRDRKMCFGLPMIRIRHLQTIYNYPRLV